MHRLLVNLGPSEGATQVGLPRSSALRCQANGCSVAGAERSRSWGRIVTPFVRGGRDAARATAHGLARLARDKVDAARDSPAPGCAVWVGAGALPPISPVCLGQFLLVILGSYSGVLDGGGQKLKSSMMLPGYCGWVCFFDAF